MAAGVREEIEDDEIQPPAMDDVILVICGGIFHAAENTAFHLVSRRNVAITPGTPKMIHKTSIQESEVRIEKEVGCRRRFLFWLLTSGFLKEKRDPKWLRVA